LLIFCAKITSRQDLGDIRGNIAQIFTLNFGQYHKSVEFHQKADLGVDKAGNISYNVCRLNYIYIIKGGDYYEN
jgi:hypothetical protein